MISPRSLLLLAAAVCASFATWAQDAADPDTYLAFEQIRPVLGTPEFKANQAGYADIARRRLEAILADSPDIESLGDQQTAELAVVYFFLDEVDTGMAILAGAMARSPESSHLFHARAQGWKLLGKTDAAIADLRQAAIESFDREWIEAELFELVETTGGPAVVVREATAILDVHADDFRCLRRRGEAHLALGNREQAIADFREWARIEPRDAEARQRLADLGQPTVVPALTARELEHPRHRKRDIYLARHFFEMARTFEADGRLQEAVIAYDNAVLHDRDLYDAWMNLARIHEQSEAFEAALAAYTGADACRYQETTDAIVALPYARARAYQAAVKEPEAALAGDPKNPDALIARGIARRRHGKPEAALADFQAAAQICPDAPAAWEGQGDCLLILERPAESAVAYSRALALDPSNGRLVRSRWNAWLRAGDKAIFVDCEERLGRGRDDAAVLYARAQAHYAIQKDFDGAIVDCRKAIAIDGDPDMRCIRLIRQIHIDLQQWDAVVEDLWQQIAQDPEDIELRWMKADAFRRMGDEEKRLSEYQYAAMIDPFEGETFDYLAQIYREKRMVDEAVEAMRKLNACFPGYHDGRYFLGEYLRENKRYREAIDEFEAIARRPGSGRTKLQAILALGHTHVALGQFDRAAGDYGVYLALEDDSTVRAWRNAALVASGGADGALRSMGEQITRSPDAPGPLLARGSLLVELGRPKDAVADFERAAKLLPASLDTLEALGDAHLAAGNFTAAIDAYDRFVAIHPTHENVLRSRGIAHAQLGTDEGRRRALEDFERCVQLDPDDTQNRKCLAMAGALMGNLQPMIDLLTDGIEKRPGAMALRMERARYFRHRGRAAPEERQDDLRAAIADARAVVGADVHETEAWDIICFSYDDLLDYDRAEAAFQQARAANPSYPRPSLLKSFGAKVDREEAARRAADAQAQAALEAAERARRAAEAEAERTRRKSFAEEFAALVRQRASHGGTTSSWAGGMDNLEAAAELQRRINAEMDFARERREFERSTGGAYTLSKSKPW